MAIDSSMIQFKDRGNQDSSVYPISLQKAIYDSSMNDNLTTYITEYNISLHQVNKTAAVGAPRRDTSIFTLSEAIAQVPDEYKHGGLKLTFNSDMLGVNCVRNYVLDSSVWTGNVKSWYEEGSNAMVGYYTCTSGANQNKVVNDASGYVLSLGGSMKIKFSNRNTVANPTLNINGQGAKSITYDGSTCSSTNTWEAGETVEAYYDGSVYQLNNVAGGGTFKTGQKVKEVGIDSEPIAESENLVKSGGVQNELALGAVYDVSAKNPTAGPNNDGKWESLSALLSDANLNTLIPISVRKGGMSIKFVQSSDNKYVQSFLTKNEWSANEADWEKMNLEEEVSQLGNDLNELDAEINGEHLPKAVIGQIASNGRWNTATSTSHYAIPITPGDSVRLVGSANYTRYTFLKSYSSPIVVDTAVDYATGYESGDNFPYVQLDANADTGNIVSPSDANYIYVAKTIGLTPIDRTPSTIYINGNDIISDAGLKGDVQMNTTNIELLKARVSEAEGGITRLAGRVASVENEVDGFVDDMDAVKETLYGEHFHEYPPLNSDILVNAVIISTGVVNTTPPRCGYYVPLLGGEHITGRARTGTLMYYCCVKSIVTTSDQPADLATGWTGTQQSTSGGTIDFTASEDARYLYIGHIVTSDATAIKDPAELVINDWDVINQRYIGESLPSGLVERVETLESKSNFSGLLSLTVAEHNEGMYHYGTKPYGISQADWDAGVTAWKSLLTKTNSDFLACMEHKPILNASEDGVTDVSSYNTLYKQFYPYRVDGDTLGSTTFQVALYSKYPIKSYRKVNYTVSNLYYNEFIVEVNGIEICFLIQKGHVGVPDTPDAAIRVAEFTEMVNNSADYPIVIIPIDTNSQYTEDFDVFRNNGYQLGNFGYWGRKVTCGISETYPQGHYAFDNIIVKGMNINSFDVCDEHATSDHFPTMAKLTKYFE